jgi:HNH endonuclease
VITWLERAVATGIAVAVLAVWVLTSFVSGSSAPLGLKLVGTTSFAIVLGAILLIGGILIFGREEEIALPTRAARRRSIPRHVKREVWQRDEGQCRWVEDGIRCGRREDLEFDHIRPFSKGGADTVRNLQLLCQEHNRRKAAKLLEPLGDADVPVTPDVTT